jgi:hypothetical protein
VKASLSLLILTSPSPDGWQGGRPESAADEGSVRGLVRPDGAPPTLARTAHPLAGRVSRLPLDSSCYQCVHHVTLHICFIITTIITTATIVIIGIIRPSPSSASSSFYPWAQLSPCDPWCRYAEEYEESLRECMDGTDDLAALLESHQKHVESVKQNRPLHALVTRLRETKGLLAETN